MKRTHTVTGRLAALVFGMLGAVHAGGCIPADMAHLVQAKPLEQGRIQLTPAAGMLADTNDSIFPTLSLQAQFGIHERFNAGLRFGIPHGLSINALVNLYQDEHFALSIDPAANVNWWYFDDNLNNVRAELPVLFGALFDDSELTLLVSYGAQFYFAGGTKVIPGFAQFVTAQLSGRISVQQNGRGAFVPFVSYSHFFYGKRLGSSHKIAVGLGYSFF